MKNTFLKIYLIIFTLGVLVVPVFAQTPIKSQGDAPISNCTDDTIGGMENATKYCLTAPIPIFGTEVDIKNEGLGTYINKAISFLISIGALLAVLMIIKYGFTYMLKDTPMAISQAKSGMKDALLGLVLVMSTYLILKTINPRLVEFSLSLNSTGVIDIKEDNEDTTLVTSGSGGSSLQCYPHPPSTPKTKTLSCESCVSLRDKGLRMKSASMEDGAVPELANALVSYSNELRKNGLDIIITEAYKPGSSHASFGHFHGTVVDIRLTKIGQYDNYYTESSVKKALDIATQFKIRPVFESGLPFTAKLKEQNYCARYLTSHGTGAHFHVTLLP